MPNNYEEKKSDLEIAQAAKMLPIAEIAKKIGLDEDDYDLYGKYKAKVSLDVMEKFAGNKDGKFVTVTAITPTPLGEGKTVTNIGLVQALDKIGKNVIGTLREPSMGPVFGIKGGAAGGGYSQVVPMEDINLHFTGDIHAVGAAHNLLSAMLDTHIQKGNKFGIDLLNISWRRVVDISDRALRQIVIGLGGSENGLPRETGYDITVSSEVMAILALASDLFDLRKRLGKIVIGYSTDGKPVSAEDLKAAGAMCVILKEALKPNLIQSLENVPYFMHAGPFANIAFGNNSVVADKIALKLADYVITESGFGADCGAEKLFDVKCRQSGLKLDTVVITCSVRALKYHGGLGFIPGVPAGQSMDMEALNKEDLGAVEKGGANLAKQIANMKLFGIPVVVSVNRFLHDTDKEVELVQKIAKEAGAEAAVPIEVWAYGGDGGVELAKAVVEACEKPSQFKLLYPDDMPIEEKIRTVATKIYNAKDVSISPVAMKKIKLFTDQGLGNLPMNIAKTHLSLSHDPQMKGVPKDYIFPITDIRPAVGAGFLFPLAGTMSTMPGLPLVPAATKVDIDKDGITLGLF